MATVTNALTTYDSPGIREDLWNVIFRIDPSDTPVTNAVGRRNVKQNFFQWTVDQLRAPNFGNAQPQGFTTPYSAALAPVRRTNVCQISQRDITITGSDQAALQVGDDPMAYGLAKSGQELRRDIEIAFVSRQVQNLGADGVAAQTEGFAHSILSNVFAAPTPTGGTAFAAGGLTSPSTADTQTLTSAGAYVYQSFTEDLLANAMGQSYLQGAIPDKLFVNFYNKRKMITFTGRISSRTVTKPNVVSAAVDTYSSDYGDIDIIPHRWLPNGNPLYAGLSGGPTLALGISTNYAMFAAFRPFEVIEPGITGDAKTNILLSEWGVMNANEKSHFRIESLAPTAALDPTPV